VFDPSLAADLDPNSIVGLEISLDNAAVPQASPVAFDGSTLPAESTGPVPSLAGYITQAEAWYPASPPYAHDYGADYPDVEFTWAAGQFTAGMSFSWESQVVNITPEPPTFTMLGVAVAAALMIKLGRIGRGLCRPNTLDSR